MYVTPEQIQAANKSSVEALLAVANAQFSAFAKRFLMDLSSYIARVNYRCADVVSPVADFNTRWEVRWGVERERLVVTRRDDDAVPLQRFAHATDVGPHDGAPARHRLEDYIRASFTVAQETEEISCTIPEWQFCLRNTAM